MLTHLRIHNIILVEQADIAFSKGFNVLSGETGSGKSAILKALELIAGERADTSLIRKGSDKGTVEATFDTSHLPHIHTLLDNAGIAHDPAEELIIRREISSTGKSRAFINNQQVQLTLLRELNSSLLEMVGQHANQKLFSIENHREILDLFGELESDLITFAKSWSEENRCREQLELLLRSETERFRNIKIYEAELEEIEGAQLKPDEDETLFSEYTLLTNAGDLSQYSQQLCQALSEDRNAVLPTLSKHQQILSQLLRLDPTLSETEKAYNSALLELQEIAYTLRNYHSRIEHNPMRTQEITNRLSLIERLKKRYGSTIQKIQEYATAIRAKLTTLQNSDLQIEELRTQLQAMEAHTHKLSQELTRKRGKSAETLENEITKELVSLNMSKALFYCTLSKQTRSRHGDDRIEFFLAPNVGEHRIPIKDCASGGELSRVMLALQTLLAGKSQIPTLIFDEIDANIGGETAAIVGEKLRAIGENHQVICITHFPQVAKEAHHHLQISKKEKDGRTVTFVTLLDKKMRKEELTRMLGGRK